MTFSRFFPGYHPRNGEPTYFLEKLWAGWLKIGLIDDIFVMREDVCFDFGVYKDCTPKYHTIRAGHRWKVGDKFSPRVWSGTPYRSKQVVIGPDIEVKKVWDIRIKPGLYWINDKPFFNIYLLAERDGLEMNDLVNWFHLKPGKVFDGQIICWNENIKY